MAFSKEVSKPQASASADAVTFSTSRHGRGALRLVVEVGTKIMAELGWALPQDVRAILGDGDDLGKLLLVPPEERIHAKYWEVEEGSTERAARVSIGDFPEDLINLEVTIHKLKANHYELTGEPGEPCRGLVVDLPRSLLV
jgi:hypothetical protein